MVIVKKTKITNVSNNVEKLETLKIVEMVKGTTYVYNINVQLAYGSTTLLSDTYPKELKTAVHVYINSSTVHKSPEVETMQMSIGG